MERHGKPLSRIEYVDRVRVASDTSPKAIQTFVACQSGAFQTRCSPLFFMSFSMAFEQFRDEV